MEREKTIRDLLEELNDNLKEKPKVKKGFKIPFKSKVSGSKAKKGWTTALVIKENRNVDFQKYLIDEQSIVVDGIPRIVTPEETLYYKGKPFVIVPNWSVKPFSPEKNYEEAVRNQLTSQGYKLLLNKLKSEAIKPKKSVSGLVGIGIVLALAALGYMAYKGGWFT